jgi:hypothetical protein
LERWSALRPREIEDELKRAHTLIFEKLPPKTKAILAMPEKDRAKIIRERKKVLAAKAKASTKSAKPRASSHPTHKRPKKAF